MEIAYHINQFVPIDAPTVPLQDRGYQYGDGIYEVIRVYDGLPFMLAEHLDRLERSAAAIRLALPMPRARIEQLVEEGIRRSEMAEAQVYLQLTRGVAPRSHPFPAGAAPVFAMTVRAIHMPADEKYHRGARVLLREDERWAQCWIKTINLLPNVLARQEALEAGCDEAVLIHEGRVNEGSSCNVFAVAGGVLFTPPASRRMLSGIVRMAVLDIARELEVEVREEPFAPPFLAAADEAFLTSTTIELLPIAEFAGLAAGRPHACPGPVTRALHEAYRARARQLAIRE